MRKIWRDKRGKYRKIIVWIWFFLLFLELTIYPACVQAAGKSITVTVTGLEEQDRLHLYALSQNGEWADSITEWLQADLENEVYAGFLRQGPSVLRHLSAENAGRFIQTIIQAMKKEDGSFSLEAADVTFEESGSSGGTVVSAGLSEGYYIAVAEGKRRIYAPVLLIAEEEGNLTYTYTDDDWSVPQMEQTLLKNGGTVTDSSRWVKTGDKLELSLAVTQGSYTEAYSIEKRICSISQVYENGILWKADTLRLTGKDGRKLIIDEDYTVNFTENACVFRFGGRTDAPAAFYRFEGWYYFMDGAVAGEELAQAVTQYNEVYHASWEEEDVQEEEHCSVLCIMVDAWEEELAVACELETGNLYNGQDNCILESQFLYSVSPISVDGLGVLDENAVLNSRSIRLTLLDGGISGSPEPDEGAPGNMAGAVFQVFFKAGTLENSPDSAAIQSFVEEHGGGVYRAVWNTDRTSADIYVGAGTIQTDGDGTGGIGGLEEGDYLVMQTVYPDGYAVTRTGLLLTAQDWPADGNIKDITWTDYKGVYLPETGGCGAGAYQKAGLWLLAVSVMLAGIRQYRTGREKRCE